MVRGGVASPEGRDVARAGDAAHGRGRAMPAGGHCPRRAVGGLRTTFRGAGSVGSDLRRLQPGARLSGSETGCRPARLARLDFAGELSHIAPPLPSTGGVCGGPNPAPNHSERSPHPMPDVTTPATTPSTHLAPYANRGLKGRIFSGVQPSGNLHLGNY